LTGQVAQPDADADTDTVARLVEPQRSLSLVTDQARRTSRGGATPPASIVSDSTLRLVGPVDGAVILTVSDNQDVG